MLLKAREGRIELMGWDVTKDWVYVDDVADDYTRALASGFVGAINIGTGREASLGHVATVIANAFEAVLTPSPANAPGPTRMLCDASRAFRVLGWQPKVQLEEGLSRTIEAWRKQTP